MKPSIPFKFVSDGLTGPLAVDLTGDLTFELLSEAEVGDDFGTFASPPVGTTDYGTFASPAGTQDYGTY
jgi:hypothetical protein